MQNSIVQEKLKFARPDILIKTDIKDIRIHEFLKAETIFNESKKAKNYLKRKLEKLIEHKKAV
jgi:predicted acylesterase/phospholipase RssA